VIRRETFLHSHRLMKSSFVINSFEFSGHAHQFTIAGASRPADLSDRLLVT
jgi:hypothetical protein